MSMLCCVSNVRMSSVLIIVISRFLGEAGGTQTGICSAAFHGDLNRGVALEPKWLEPKWFEPKWLR
eukprot:1619504-Heterocapsa_arctica.AAC.1